MAKLTSEDVKDKIDAEERAKNEESATRRLLTQERNKVHELERMVHILTELDGIEATPPEWASPKQAKSRHAIANLMLSDLHLDEVVDPASMRGRNAFNREIAMMRIRKVGDNTIKMARDYISGVTYDGLFLWVNGDTVSGFIHDELVQTNEGVSPIDSVDYWVEPIGGLIQQLADFFGRVHVVWTIGNHGRSYQKPPAKGAVRSSFDWAMGRNMWRMMRTDDRLTWNIPESPETTETHYAGSHGEFVYHVEHGDAFKGGDQIAGAVRPVMMGDYRTLVAEIVDGVPYDMLLVGHFHQLIFLPRAIVNGSVVGYNEYGAQKKFRPERSQQAFWLTTPEHGASFFLPVIVSDRKKEGW